MTGHESIQVVGWLATILTLASGLPQTIKLVRTRDTQGVSEWTYVLWAATALWWAGWGFHIDSVPMIAVNLLLLPMLITVVVLLRPDRHQLAFLLASPPLLMVSLLVSPSLVAVVGTVLACLLAVPAVVEVFRTDDPSGVAVATWALLAMACVLWVIYDVGIGYPLTATSLVVQAGLSGVVIGRTILDQRRLTKIQASQAVGQAAGVDRHPIAWE
jgi:MtN3 and saliva related transmembrane protein